MKKRTHKFKGRTIMKSLLLIIMLLLTGCFSSSEGEIELTLDKSIQSSGNRLLNAILIHFNTGTVSQESSYVDGRVNFNNVKYMNSYSIALRFIDKNKQYGLYSCHFPKTKNYLYLVYKGKQVKIQVMSLGLQDGVGVATCKYI